MGFFLNSNVPCALYKTEINRPYFVDKTPILKDLFPLVETGKQYICIARPRRFGKSMMANMIGAFFGRNGDGSVFDELAAAELDGYIKHRNNHNVIYIDFSKMPNEKSYDAYIGRIKSRLKSDLKQAYPDCVVCDGDTLWDILTAIFIETEERFIFVFDEWDFIFNRDFVSDEDKDNYIEFLRNLLKDQPYVELTYMTGILPIANYSTGSGLNMFMEYTMITQPVFSSYFGFTDAEVDMLYGRYLKIEKHPQVTRKGLREWYDGYRTVTGERMYNPRSVVLSLTNNKISDYWTSSGPYDEIFGYVKNNIAGVRDDIAKMIAGESVTANVRQYAAAAMHLRTRDEIISAMLVYGFLTCDVLPESNAGTVSIPNRELMEKFIDMVRDEPDLGYVHRLAAESARMLAATKAGDTEVMEEILQRAHDTETGMTDYNNEAELSAVVKLVYLSARDTYDIRREDKAGRGFVDYIFYPKNDMSDDCIIIELKIDSTPEKAIEQIKDRNYAQSFIGKLGEPPRYTGRILAVGIAYHKSDTAKQHKCRIEILRERE